MTLDSFGISVTYRPPVVSGVGPSGSLTGDWSGLNLVKDAAGGFLTATLTLHVDKDEAEDWAMAGLGRDICVKDGTGDVAWEGFLDSVRCRFGAVGFRRGPVSGIVNRCLSVYTECDTGVNPPARTPGLTTPLADAAASQARYGVWEKPLVCGECTYAEAVQARDGHLAEHAEPDSSGEFAAGGGAVELTLECSGYWAWLQAYPYEELLGGTQTIQTKMQAILAADPNGVLSTDYTHLGPNATLSKRYEDSGTPAWDVVKGLVKERDAFGNRWTFGVYAGRVAWYEAAPGVVTYRHLVADQGQRIMSAAGEVRPWAIRPGRWLFLTNLLSGRTPPVAALADDPRAMFVERVQYDAPDSVTITGTRRTNKAQVIAMQGFSGLGG